MNKNNINKTKAELELRTLVCQNEIVYDEKIDIDDYMTENQRIAQMLLDNEKFYVDTCFVVNKHFLALTIAFVAAQNDEIKLNNKFVVLRNVLAELENHERGKSDGAKKDLTLPDKAHLAKEVLNVLAKYDYCVFDSHTENSESIFNDNGFAFTVAHNASMFNVVAFTNDCSLQADLNALRCIAFNSFHMRRLTIERISVNGKLKRIEYLQNEIPKHEPGKRTGAIVLQNACLRNIAN